MSRFVQLLLVVALLSLLAGCAAAPKQPTVFYPPLPQQPRLQYLTSITSEEDLGKKGSAFREFVLGKESALKQLARPHDLGSVKGKWYVSDRTLKRVLIVDLGKGEFDVLKGDRLGALKEPFGLHVTDDGYKYVTDAERKQVVVYGPDDNYVRAYGEENQFERPVDVALFGNRLYVVDTPRHVVQVLDKESGKTVQTIGGRGTEAGKMDRPLFVRVDRQGNLFVNDSFNFRIQKFDPHGTYLKEFGFPGINLGGFARPKGMDISPDGDILYVSDAAFENVQLFDTKTADLMLFFGDFGTAPGSLYLPTALYVDDKNLDYFQRYADKDFKIRYLVIVGNMLGKKKLNIYGFGDWIGEKLPEMAPPKKVTTEKQPGKPDAPK